MNPKTLSATHINAIVYTLFFLFPLVGMGVDLIAPSLPAIAQDVHIAFATSKNLISSYLIGFSFGTLLLGFISEAVGRRTILLCGFFSFFLISMLPIVLPDAVTLIITRFCQGFAISTLSVLARVVFSDILDDQRLRRSLPMLATMWGIGPIIGPIIGGYLQDYFNWQACFIFYALFSLLGFILLFFILPETLPKKEIRVFKQTLINLCNLSINPVFVGSVLVMGFTYALLIIFNTLGPFFTQVLLNHSAIYFGRIAFIMGSAFLLGTLIARLLLRRWIAAKIMHWLTPIFLLLSLVGLLGSVTIQSSPWITFVASGLMCFGCGILYPTALTHAMTLFRQMAGTSSALMGLITMIITGLTAFGISFLPINAISINGLYVFMMVLTSLSYYGLVAPLRRR